MSDYIKSMIILSCFCSFVISFLKHGSKLKKYVAFSVSVVAVYSVLTPIFDIVFSIKDLSFSCNFDQDHVQAVKGIDVNEWTIKLTDEELKRSICNIAQEKFDIELITENLIISYDFSDYSNVKIIKVIVDFSDSVIIKNVRELEYYISELLLCECEVVGA